MLIWLVLSGLAVTHKVVISSNVGQLQCPRVPASFEDDLDLSSFSVLLNQSAEDTEWVDGNQSDGGHCKLTTID